jgi:NAD(P)-dependent dehydrogenase (short-subunit alcohol dehydrogenase family)
VSEPGIAGRVALVTGAGRGIGAGICEVLSANGALVAVNDIFPERAASVAERIAGKALAVSADVTDLNAVGEMVAKVVRELGPIEILVNNAGLPAPMDGEETAFFREFRKMDPASWQRILDVIIQGTLNCTHTVLPAMVERKRGRIINISSDSGRVGTPGASLYSLAKAGVVGFSKAFAQEVGPHGITVNCVSPGATETESAAAWLSRSREQVMAQYPLASARERLGTPSDIGLAVLYFASDSAEWVTGQVLSVNGGTNMVD